ncbi:ATP-dependent DNA helicase RecG [Christensenella tenuis]|uniref:ATP-dependent DNA helicase RecG n=1 Tax=Christensenella tenuis TaxID=2763033 RepID=A0ABR7EBB9_9FIRM|nr:ATP-dependent DNA helicase RecG [Christensenella tenuis]MBC5647077.1 ATP-dependent DNA helicase RecG [Christensenella tenuis]
MELNESVRSLPGVGEKTAELLQKVEISTVKDLLYYLPRAYKDFSHCKKIRDVSFGETAFFKVKILSQPQVRRPRYKLEITSFQVSDGTGIAIVDIFNQVYIKNNIVPGNIIYIYGKLEQKFGKVRITSPELYFKKPQESFLPIYPLTAGLTQNMLRKFLREALHTAEFTEVYSDVFLRKNKLFGLKEALREVHFPETAERAEKARLRIIFDELLLFNRMLELLGEEKRLQNRIRIEGSFLEEFSRYLSFELTGAQKRVMREIENDLTGEQVMNRLVQGDVGSGKTVIAFFAMYCMYQNGYQSILMAPTEILARQHYETALKLFPEEKIVCLTGALTAKKKSELREKVADGTLKIIIGTHALLYGDISFENLGLIITDEQHRFGVKQRAALSGGRQEVHTLIMSATPIPRTLSLVLFGHTDISVVDELPPGRKEIKTYLIHGSKYNDMIGFIANELNQGRQAYIVCPLIEDSGGMEAKSAKQMFDELKSCYPGKQMALIHGKLKNAEKQKIMEDFSSGSLQILVSTTVIEVGINVPNATVMAVMNAERFGLAQLHQLRGRVGRGKHQSYCFLVSDNQNAYERLRVLVSSNDGFKIAEKDMQIRGTGDLLGTRQHGAGTLKVANLITDMGLLIRTREVLDQLKKSGGPEYGAITAAAKEELKKKLIEIALN